MIKENDKSLSGEDVREGIAAVISVKVKEPCQCVPCCCCCVNELPKSVHGCINGALCDYRNGDKELLVSLGFFSVIRIERPAQLVVNASEYCIPDKECISPREDDPCSVFRSMAFPISEFSCSTATGTPHTGHDKGNGGKCGC